MKYKCLFSLIGLLVVLQFVSYGQDPYKCSSLMWQECFAEARYEHSQGNYKAAASIAQETLGKVYDEFGAVHENYGLVFTFLALQHYEIGEYELAQMKYEESLQIFSKTLGDNHPIYAACQSGLADVFQIQGKLNRAELLFEENVEILASAVGRRSDFYALGLNKLAQLFIKKEEYKRAQDLLEEALSIARNSIEITPINLALIISNRGKLYEASGEYRRAYQLVAEATDLVRQEVGISHPYYGHKLADLANILESLGDFDQALDLYNQSADIAERTLGEDHPSYGIALTNLGGFYRKMGYYERAKASIIKGLQIVRKTLGTGHFAYAESLQALGALNMIMGHIERSEQLYEEALDILKKSVGEQHSSYAGALSDQAVLYLDMGLYDKAILTGERSVELKAQLYRKDHPELGRALSILATIYLTAEHYKEAKTLAKESLDILHGALGSDHIDYVKALNGLVVANLKLGFHKEAASLFDENLGSIETILGPEHPEYTAALFNKAMSLQITNYREEAKPVFIKAASSYLDQLRRYYPMLSEDEKLRFLKNNIGYNLDAFYSFALRVTQDSFNLDPFVADLNLASKGLGLSTSINVQQQAAQSNRPPTQKIVEEWNSTRRRYKEAVLMGVEQRNNMNISLRVLQAQIDSLEGLFNKNTDHSAFLFSESSCQWMDVHSALSKGEIAISFINYRYHNGAEWTDVDQYAAIVIDPDIDRPEVIEICTSDEILPFLAGENVLKEWSYVTDVHQSLGLYQLICSPLLKYIEKSQTIHFSVSGLLNQIAFTALRDEEDDFPFRARETHQYTTLRDFVWHSSTSTTFQGNSIACFGGADFNAGASEQMTDSIIPYWMFLPGSDIEAEKIGDLFESSGWEAIKLIGDRATEENFKGLDESLDPRILHIASHGFFIDPHETKLDQWDNAEIQRKSYPNSVAFLNQPLLHTGVVLSGANLAWQGILRPSGQEDGILSAYEVVHQNLHDTELVVLSACESGLGEIVSKEGVLGLQRAFKLAGVDKIIMSLWNIEDIHTTEFMEIFYRSYLEGNKINAAFSHAQKYMAAKYDPYYWAGFVLIE